MIDTAEVRYTATAESVAAIGRPYAATIETDHHDGDLAIAEAFGYGLDVSQLLPLVTDLDLPSACIRLHYDPRDVPVDAAAIRYVPTDTEIVEALRGPAGPTGPVGPAGEAGERGCCCGRR